MAVDEKALISLVKEVPDILGQLYSDLAQPSVQAVGKALGTVFEFSTSILLPLKLLNERNRINFTKRIDEYRNKLDQIPEENRCEVHPQIGTPIVEKLSYTTNDEIAELYTSLLAKASNIDTANQAHPSFVSIIERLSVDEARIIKYLDKAEFVEYCEFHAYTKDGSGYHVLPPTKRTLLSTRVNFLFPKNEGAYLSNLVSLGILEDMKGVYKVDTTETDKIKVFYNLKSLEQKLVPALNSKIEVEKSYFRLTEFGRLFVSACMCK